MGEAVKRIHENTPMSPLFRLEEKNSNKQKRGKEVVTEVSSFRSCDKTFVTAFSMPMKRPLDKMSSSLVCSLFYARMCLAIIWKG